MKVRVDGTVIEGYADKPTARLSESYDLECEMVGVPRVGDYVETGYGSHRVKTVFWDTSGEPPTVRLEVIYTCAETMEVVLVALAV